MATPALTDCVANDVKLDDMLWLGEEVGFRQVRHILRRGPNVIFTFADSQGPDDHISYTMQFPLKIQRPAPPV